jgi:DNA-binding NarL/FixJ family response regulator
LTTPETREILQAVFPNGIPLDQFDVALRVEKAADRVITALKSQITALPQPAQRQPATSDGAAPKAERTKGESRLLSALRKGCTIKELAEFLDISPQGARTNVQRLEAKGFKFRTEKLESQGAGRPTFRYTLIGEP